MSTLVCDGLDVSIGGLRVVANLGQAFKAGEFWGVLGANGTGKTTLLRHLAGLLRVDAGSIRIDDQTLDQWPRKTLAQTLGMLQQHSSYVFDASVLQAALIGRHPYLNSFQRESNEDIRLARCAIERVDLGDQAERSVTSLSGGEARRLGFATLLVQDPEIMLLDEPTNHLDFRHQVRVMRAVGDLVYRQQRTALAALHDVNLAATYCSHVLMLFGDGQWRAGSAPDLLKAELLEQLYQCPVTAIQTDEGMRFHPSFAGISEPDSSD